MHGRVRGQTITHLWLLEPLQRATYVCIYGPGSVHPCPSSAPQRLPPTLGAEGQLEIAAPGNKEVTICASPGARTPVS